MSNPNTHWRENQASTKIDDRQAAGARKRGRVARRDAECASAQGEPPASNTGVLITSSGVILDFLTFTLPVKTVEEMTAVIAEWTKLLGGSTAPARGFHGYTESVKVLETGRLAWDRERCEMGVHVSLPATALANFALLYSSDSLYYVNKLIIRILDRGGKFRRVDFAIDTESVTVGHVQAAMVAGELVSPLRKHRFWGDPLTGAIQTLEIGSRESDRFLRIYDKGLQMGGEAGILTRFELEMKGNYANAAMHTVMRDGTLPESFIVTAIDFREVSDESNTTRRERCSWWQAIIGQFERVTLGLGRVKTTVQRAKEWLEKQVAPTMAWVGLSEGEAMAFIHQLYRNGRDRIPPARRALLAAQGFA